MSAPRLSFQAWAAGRVIAQVDPRGVWCLECAGDNPENVPVYADAAGRRDERCAGCHRLVLEAAGAPAICAWCAPLAEGEPDNMSHGVCGACDARVRSEWGLPPRAEARA